MRLGRARGSARTALAGAAMTLMANVAACSPTSETERAPSVEARALAEYAASASVRRRAMEESLVSRDNTYARLRLAKYDDAAWGSLPEWNPPARAVRRDDLGHEAPSPSPDWPNLDMPQGAWDDAELRDLGRRAFFEYPVQLAPYARAALAKRVPAELGLWQDGARVGGLVWVALPDGGGAEVALTCSTCHASEEPGGLVAGKNNARLRVDALTSLAGGVDATDWGPGRVDVTDDGIHNPTAIPDLRPIRWQRNLHRAATVRNGIVALAIRTETLVITSLHQSVRPPRKIAAALAAYLWSLGEVAPPRPAFDEGANLFARECGRCHQGEGASGEPVAIADVGTDPRVGASPDRGTGSYRVPSLRFVGDRTRLLADGAVEDVGALLDPSRRVPGHRYGLDMDEPARRALVRHLETF